MNTLKNFIECIDNDLQSTLLSNVKSVTVSDKFLILDMRGEFSDISITTKLTDHYGAPSMCTINETVFGADDTVMGRQVERPDLVKNISEFIRTNFPNEFAKHCIIYFA